MTNRQYLAWQEWMAEDMNHPSRTDHYIMRATQEMLLPHLKAGAEPPELKEYVLKFGAPTVARPKDLEETDGPPIVTDELILEAQKQMTAYRLGGVNVERRWVNKRGEPIPDPSKEQ